MSINRYAARRDENEQAVVDALEAAGASVTRLGQPMDLLVGYQGRNTLLEVKKPLGPRGGKSSANKQASGGDAVYTKKQLDWRKAWRGELPITVRTPAEALAAIGFGTASDEVPAAVEVGWEAIWNGVVVGVVAEVMPELVHVLWVYGGSHWITRVRPMWGAAPMSFRQPGAAP